MKDGLGDWRNAKIGGQVNPGWEPLVDALYARLIEIAPEIVVDQVKEKFGMLRFYYTLPTEVAEREAYVDTIGWHKTVGAAVTNIVSSAENASSWICEVCGATGARTDSFGHGWLNTLCSTHAEARRISGTPAWQQVAQINDVP